MDVRRFANTWNSIHSFNNFLRVVVICLIVTNIVSVFGWIGKDQLVLILRCHSNEFEISFDSAYKESIIPQFIPSKIKS